MTTGRITLSRADDFTDAIAPEPGQAIEGKFYTRVMLRDLPTTWIEDPDPDIPEGVERQQIRGDAIKLTSATLYVDGKKVAGGKNPKASRWLSDDEIEVLHEGPSAIIEFASPFTSQGAHSLKVVAEFADGSVSETTAEISPPDETEEEPHPAVTMLQDLGATPITVDVVARLLRDESADVDQIKEALTDIGKISNKDLSLFEIRTLAGLAQGMRDGMRQVAVAREQLRLAVEGNG